MYPNSEKYANEKSDDSSSSNSIFRRLAEKQRRLEEARKRGSDLRGAYAYSLTLGIELALFIGGGIALGYTLDKKAGTLPLFIVIFALAGFAAGFYLIMRRTITAEKQEEAAAAKAEKESPSDE